MKKIKIFVSLICFVLFLPQVSFGQGAADASKFAQAANFAAAGGAGAHAATNAAACSPKNVPACIQAILGIIQQIQSLKGAGNSGSTGSALANGDFGEFDPNEAGFCLDPSKGCKPDLIDKQLVGLDKSLKAGDSLGKAITDLTADAEKKLAGFAAKGFKIDQANGTITGPNGKVTTIANSKTKIPKSLSDLANKKIANIRASLGGRSLASGSSGSSGVTFKDEYYGGSGSKKNASKLKKKKKNSLLAGLSDKDARNGGIGVSGDNIFGMVNRRYKKKTKAAEFLKQ